MAEVVFRADASLAMGTGHVMRCLTLAEALRSAGHSVRFVTRALRGHLGARIGAAGFDVTLLPAPSGDFVPAPGSPVHAIWAGVDWEEDARDVVAALGARGADWLVVDHYAFDARWERAVAGSVGRVMVWDDLADRAHACDLLLDQNLGRSALSYAGLVEGGTRVLAGPRFAVLRPEFAELRAGSLAARQGRGLRRILVSMGGVDQPNATGAVLEVLAGVPGLEGVQVEVILGRQAPALDAVRAQASAMAIPVELAVDVDDMAARMARADLALGAVGGTAWERCALGLPSLLLVIADNQRPAAAALDATGAAVLLGDLSDPDWGARLAAWLGSPNTDARLERLSAAAAALCDGAGARRVRDELLRPVWRLRDAREEDARAVYELRYASGPDRFAQTPEVPTYADHAAWFARAVAGTTRRIRILDIEGQAAGYIRLDLEGERATVSLCLSPERRGGGWGGLLLDEAARLGYAAGCAVLGAVVHQDNAASLRLFERAGYTRTAPDGAFQTFALGIRSTP